MNPRQLQIPNFGQAQQVASAPTATLALCSDQLLALVAAQIPVAFSPEEAVNRAMDLIAYSVQAVTTGALALAVRSKRTQAGEDAN